MFDVFNNKIHFKNLSNDTSYWLNTLNGTNNFTLPEIIDKLTINELNLVKSLHINNTTQLQIGPENLR